MFKAKLFIITALFVLAASFSYSEREITPEMNNVMKKVVSASIKNAFKTSNTLSKAAEKVGVDVEELKQLCYALDISLDKYKRELENKKIEPVKIEPLKITSMKNESVEKMKDPDFEPDVILEYRGVSPYVFVVEKSSHKIFVLKYENGVRSLEAVFDCKTGKNKGDKQAQGDRKTPEGVFFLINKYDRSQLLKIAGKENAYLYGDMAFVTDYPNCIDQLNNKDGSGIWLHGTDQKFDSSGAEDTRGCVVTTNDNIRKLSKYIELHKTPLIITESLDFYPKKEFENQKNEFFSMVEKWRSSWQEERLDEYISFYSQKFTDRGKNLRQWRDYKAGIFGKVQIKNIKLENMIYLRHKDSLVVQFLQDYSADNLSSRNVKMLYFVKNDRSWEIIAETIPR